MQQCVNGFLFAPAELTTPDAGSGASSSSLTGSGVGAGFGALAFIMIMSLIDAKLNPHSVL